MSSTSTSTSPETGSPKMGRLIAYPQTAVADIIGNGFFIVDQLWAVSSWNDIAEKLLGISAKDMIGKNLWEKFRDAIPDVFYNTYHHALLRDIPVHFTLYWPKIKTRFDVTTCYFDGALSVSFRTLRNAKGAGSSLKRLKSLNTMYRQITEVTSDCLWEWDVLAEQILWIDGGHKRVFGYEIENALIPQRFWESRVHVDDKERILASINTYFKKGVAVDWEEEYRFKKFNGEYAYVHDRAHLIYDGEGQTSRIIGATQDITGRKSTESQLLEAERQITQQLLKNQREVTAAVLMAQEKERAIIGKELHDNLNQILGASKLYIELARTDEEDRDNLLKKAVGYIVEVIEEIRDISKNMAVPRLNVMGLAENIRILIEDIIRIEPIRIQFREPVIDLEMLPETLQLDIFRIVQEQLNNILRHAKATQAWILLTKQNDTIELVISDNGAGCDLNGNKKGIGIMNILSRAEMHQGTVSITSRPGEGYALKVSFNALA